MYDVRLYRKSKDFQRSQVFEKPAHQIQRPLWLWLYAHWLIHLWLVIECLNPMSDLICPIFPYLNLLYDDPTQYSRKRKRVIMSQTIIKNSIRWIDGRLEVDFRGRPKKTRNGRGGLYHLRILEFAKRCQEKNGTSFIDGILCGACEEVIYDGEECLASPRSIGRKYLHLMCAVKWNYI